jgi:AraC-like DNA-binding protein
MLLLQRFKPTNQMIKENLILLNVGLAWHDGDWNFKEISSPFTRIYYVTEGTATVTLESGTYTLSPGHLYIIPAFMRHTDACEGIFRHYYLHIYENVSKNSGIIEQYQFPFEIEGEQMDLLLIGELCRRHASMALKASNPEIYDNTKNLIDSVSAFRQRPEWDRVMTTGTLYHLIGRFIYYGRPKYQSAHPHVRCALDLINSRPSELLRVENLAAEIHITPDYLIRLFKKHLGCTPAQYIIDRKMMQAKLMLATESTLTKEIAYALGYDNPAYFSHIFRKLTGSTPTEYRNAFNDSFTTKTGE